MAEEGAEGIIINSEDGDQSATTMTTMATAAG